LKGEKKMDLSLFSYDNKIPLSYNSVKDSIIQDNVLIRDILIPNSKGEDISAYLISPVAQGSYPGIFFTHWFEPQAEDSNRIQFYKIAIELAKEGVISVLPDTFWSTSPSKWAQNPILPWITEFNHDKELSIRQVVELLSVFDVLLNQPNLDKNRIAYVGHDFGAMYGTLLSAFDVPVLAWVLIAGTTKFSDWFKFQSDPNKKLDPDYLKAYSELMTPYNPISHAENLSRVLFQFANNDYYVPKNKAEEFLNAAKEPKEILWYDADHGMNQETWEDMKSWLRVQLSL
jgi:dienelactone hydrolase